MVVARLALSLAAASAGLFPVAVLGARHAGPGSSRPPDEPTGLDALILRAAAKAPIGGGDGRREVSAERFPDVVDVVDRHLLTDDRSIDRIHAVADVPFDEDDDDTVSISSVELGSDEDGGTASISGFEISRSSEDSKASVLRSRGRTWPASLLPEESAAIESDARAFGSESQPLTGRDPAAVEVAGQPAAPKTVAAKGAAAAAKAAPAAAGAAMDAGAPMSDAQAPGGGEALGADGGEAPSAGIDEALAGGAGKAPISGEGEEPSEAPGGAARVGAPRSSSSTPSSVQSEREEQPALMQRSFPARPEIDLSWDIDEEEAARFVEAIGGEHMIESVTAFAGEHVAQSAKAEKDMGWFADRLQFMNFLRRRKLSRISEEEQAKDIDKFGVFLATRIYDENFIDWALSEDAQDQILKFSGMDKDELEMLQASIRAMNPFATTDTPAEIIQDVNFVYPPRFSNNKIVKMAVDVHAALLLEARTFILACTGKRDLARIEFKLRRTEKGASAMMARIDSSAGHIIFPALQPWFLDEAQEDVGFYGRMLSEASSFDEELVSPLVKWQNDPERKPGPLPGTMAFVASRSGMELVLKCLTPHIVGPTGVIELRHVCIGAASVDFLVEIMTKGLKETEVVY